MSFKWPDVPSLQDDVHVLADFAELKCWQSEGTSKRNLASDMGKLDENDYSDGVPEEDASNQKLDEAFNEIGRRQMACGEGYPFCIDPSGHVLRQKAPAERDIFILYKYLLLATRLNMNRHRVQAAINGTELFEFVAAEAARNYFGPQAEFLVFGAQPGSPRFADRVNQLCKKLGEGGGLSSEDPLVSRVRDGKLDIVVWKHFADHLPGKLIAFGQCKTGSSHDMNELHPIAFCERWILQPIPVKPLRLFLVAEAMRPDQWKALSNSNGLQFDRCRIVACGEEIDSHVMEQVRCWTSTAASTHDLPGL